MAITNADFNSTRFPGKCYATNAATLEKFKELQRQLNRLASIRGWTMTEVDGYIGPATIELFTKVYGAQSCSQIALFTEAYIPQVKALADQGGAKATVTMPKPASPPAYIPPGSTTLVPQPATSSALDMFAGVGLSSTHLMLIGGGIVAIMVLKKRKGGGARRPSRWARRRN